MFRAIGRFERMYAVCITRVRRHWRGYWGSFVSLLQIVAIVATAVFAAVEIHDMRKMKSAELMLEFQKELRDERTLRLMTAIESGRPILVENGGLFSTVDLDLLLGTYELINTSFSSGLIDPIMLYSAFSYGIVKAHTNKEVQEYLVRSRKVDGDAVFAGFSSLGRQFEAFK